MRAWVHRFRMARHRRLAYLHRQAERHHDKALKRLIWSPDRLPTFRWEGPDDLFPSPHLPGVPRNWVIDRPPTVSERMLEAVSPHRFRASKVPPRVIGGGS